MKLHLSIAATALLIFCCHSPLKSQNNFLVKTPVTPLGDLPKMDADTSGNFYVAYDTGNGYNILKYSDANTELYHLKFDPVNNAHINAIAATSDNELYVSGINNDYTTGVYHRFISYIDAAGNLLWTKTFETTKPYGLTDEIVLNNNNTAFVQFSSLASMQYIIIDQTGTVINNEAYEYPATGTFNPASGATRCMNGDVVMIGQANDFPMLIRLDENGQLLWSNTLIPADTINIYFNQPHSIAELPTGDLVIGGFCVYSDDSMSFPQTGYFMKTDADGNLLSYKLYGDANNTAVYDLYDLQISDADEISFTCYNFSQNSLFGKMNFNGDLLSIFNSPYTVQEMEPRNNLFRFKNGNYYYANLFHGDTSSILLTVSKNNELEHLLCDVTAGFLIQNDFNIPFNNDTSIANDDSASYLGNGDYIVTAAESPVYYDCADNEAPLAVEEQVQYKNKMLIYPNPASHHLYLTNDDGITAIEIYAVNGSLLLNKSYSENTTQTLLEFPESMQNGIYLIRIQNNRLQWQNERFVLSK